MKTEIKKQYKVIDTVQETPTVKTLKFVVDGGNPSFIPGQFINIYFPEFGNEEGKSYSISSSPDEKNISITVRKIGNFSGKLSNLKVNDIVTASLPYGYFFTENDDRPLIMIAGGIGISPFRSMIIDFLNKNSKREINLIYSNKSSDEIIFKSEFDDLSKKFNKFSVKYFLTRQKSDKKQIISRRINASDIKISNDYDYLICGSISFVKDFWKMLKNSGIDEINIYTESFF